MNIEKARKIDYWIGVPLCFLLSGLNFAQRLVCFKQKKAGPVKRILLIKLSELGTIILAYPLLNRIKKEYPCAELFFVTFSRNRGIFKLLGGIVSDKNILGIREEPRFFILDTLSAIKRLRQEGIDITFDLEFFSRFSAALAYLVKSSKRIGFYRYTFEGLYRGNLLTHKIQYNPLSHITKNYLSLIQDIEQLGKNMPQLAETIEEREVVFPKYASHNEVKDKVLKKIREAGVDPDKNKLLLINPGEGMLPLREWPIENFILLSKLILENNNNSVILIGTEGVSGKACAILRAINNPRCISLVKQTQLDELLELFNISQALISNDCGLAHLAMLSPVRKFIIFGPESPQIFGPLGINNRIIYANWPCSPCLSVLNHRGSLCKDNWCLKKIKAEDVYELIKNEVKF